MTKKIIYICIFVVVLAVVYYLLTLLNTVTVEDQEAIATPSISPVPSTSGQSTSTLEQELNASLQGNIDAEFQSVDADIQNL